MVDLSGRWVYNRELSDDAREKMREGREAAGPGGGGAGGFGPAGGGMSGRGGRPGSRPGGTAGADDEGEAPRAILDPAEELAIAQTGAEITVDEKFGSTRRLHPDGRKYKTDNGTSEIKASWKEGRLLVETRPDRGGSVVETWELAPERNRLVVSVKVEAGGGLGPAVTLKRVYDRGQEETTR